jgi:hypothetical protein
MKLVIELDLAGEQFYDGYGGAARWTEAGKAVNEAVDRLRFGQQVTGPHEAVLEISDWNGRVRGTVSLREDSE